MDSRGRVPRRDGSICRLTYRKRICAEKTDHAGLTLYYATLDRTLLLSDREELVRRALILSDQTAAHATLFDLPAYQQSRRSLSTNCAVRAYINPRAFDEISGHRPGSGLRAESGQSLDQPSRLSAGAAVASVDEVVRLQGRPGGLATL